MMELRWMLDKMLRRTSRDVAMASIGVKAVGALAKVAPKPPEFPWTSSLTIYLENEEEVGWTCQTSVKEAGAWNDFLRWYHGRPKSKCYVMRASDGSTMIRRKDIKRYFIRAWQSWK